MLNFIEKIPFRVAFLCSALSVATVYANVSVTTLFSNSMVLQRNTSVPIFGKASSGESVTVTFNGQTKTTTASSSGTWKVNLDPMPEGGPYTLTIKGNNTLTPITDVYMGEVWQCGGQSNMDVRVSYYPQYSSYQTSYNNPMLRFYTMRQGSSQTSGTTTNQVWKQCTNSANIGSLSCLGFFFGKELQSKLGSKIAVGLIVSAVGGTKVAQWLDPASVSANPQIATQDASTEPGTMYNAWIAPIAGCAMAGTVWMQGENDRTSGQQVYYEERFKLVINGWRKQWGIGDFPFYFVQLANGYGAQQTSADESASDNVIREAQRLALSLPNTAMVVAIDALKAGDSLHFSNKLLVGERLALIPRARQYGESSLVYAGPMYQSMTISGNKISLKFKDIGGGLITNDNKSPASFAIAGSDNKWYWATTSEIQGDIINLTCTSVSAPKNVRYAYASNPVTNLYNKEGLPAVPFTTEGNQLPVAINSQSIISYSVKNTNNVNGNLIYSVNALGQVLSISGVAASKIEFQRNGQAGRSLTQLRKNGVKQQ
jgi:sialate O-acetylesterase